LPYASWNAVDAEPVVVGIRTVHPGIQQAHRPLGLIGVADAVGDDGAIRTHAHGVIDRLSEGERFHVGYLIREEARRRLTSARRPLHPSRLHRSSELDVDALGEMRVRD